jgi:predicted DNA-binding protein (UPF0251 family)
MATRITAEQIEKINLAYLQCHTYTGAAKAAGVSPSTAKKYIIPNYEPPRSNIETILICAPAIVEISPFTTPEQIYKATELTEEEVEAMSMLWKELRI